MEGEMQGCVRVCVWLTLLCLTSAAAAQESEHFRGTLVAIEGDLVTVADADEEQREVRLTETTGLYVVTPAKFADIEPGQYVGVTSIESQGGRVALEVHVFAEDLRGTGEGHFPWDLVKEPNAMTNATIAEIEEVSPVERVLQLTYKDGEGHSSQGEQKISVPDFADVVLLESADRSVLVPERPVFMFLEATPGGPPTALAIAVGLGVAPPM
jgi:hypothetical protein